MENILPEEIITDIISRLPVESVLECRRVCKTFRTITFYPSFAHLHLRRLRQLGDKVGFVSLIYLETKACIGHLYYGEYDDENDESYKTLRKINHPTFRLANVLIGSCNGLICVSVYKASKFLFKDPAYIYNPITREYVDLPRFDETGMKDDYMTSGFGYYPKTNEYKVVRIYYRDSSSVGQVEVYTLGSGSGWRNKGEIHYRCQFGSVFANGALNWLISRDGRILSFDLADEEFNVLPSPPCLFDYYGYYQLWEWNGLLCAAHQMDGECVKIWSLKKNKKRKCSSSSNHMIEEKEYQSWSWGLEFNMEGEDVGKADFHGEYRMFALTKSGVVLLRYCMSSLSRYNMKTKVLEWLVDYAPVNYDTMETILHTNRFISLKALGEDAKIIRSADGVTKPQQN